MSDKNILDIPCSICGEPVGVCMGRAKSCMKSRSLYGRDFVSERRTDSKGKEHARGAILTQQSVLHEMTRRTRPCTDGEDFMIFDYD